MYKLKQELPKEFKIKVNPEQSEELQKHLFTLGYKWAKFRTKIQHLYEKYIYVDQDMDIYFCINQDLKEAFKQKSLPKIKFKDYFEKVTSFPEKWCIEVTEENYEELKVWVHKNSGNYRLFESGWFLNKKISIGKTLFSHSNHAWNDGYKDVFYELITTEQFRKQFGILTETKAQGTEPGTKEIGAYTTVSDKTILEWFQERQELRKEKYQLKKQNEELRLEIYKMSQEIQQLTKQNEILTDVKTLYFAEIRKLNTKIDRFKEYIKEHL